MGSVYPQRESEFVSWSLNFVTVLSASPASFGATAGQCTDVTTARTNFVNDWNVCQVPETKTKVAVQSKNATKRILQQKISVLAAVAQNFPGMNNTLRAQAGLPLREDVVSPINAPTQKPTNEVTKVDGRRVSLKVRGTDTSRRAKPEGVATISVWGFVGAAPPDNLDLWDNIGEVTRMDFDVEFGNGVPAGSMVWILCFFRNPRMQSGPMSDPIRTYLGGGVSSTSSTA